MVPSCCAQSSVPMARLQPPSAQWLRGAGGLQPTQSCCQPGWGSERCGARASSGKQPVGALPVPFSQSHFVCAPRRAFAYNH